VRHARSNYPPGERLCIRKRGRKTAADVAPHNSVHYVQLMRDRKPALAQRSSRSTAEVGGSSPPRPTILISQPRFEIGCRHIHCGEVNPQLQLLAVVAMFAVAFAVVLYRLARWLLALTIRESPRSVERQQAIAALCGQHGMVANPINLSAALSAVFPMALAGRMPVYENSFATPDGSLWAADMWVPNGDTQDKQWDPLSFLSFAVPGVNLPYVSVTSKGQKISGFARGSALTLESIDFDERFNIMADDRRSAVMLLDQGMMQWLLDCDQVSFEIVGNRGRALVRRSHESTYQPGLTPGWRLAGHSNEPHSSSRRADPIELELLFKFVAGFGPRLPELVRSEFAAAEVATPTVHYAAPPTLRSTALSGPLREGTWFESARPPAPAWSVISPNPPRLRLALSTLDAQRSVPITAQVGCLSPPRPTMPHQRQMPPG